MQQQPNWDLDYVTVEVTHNSHNPLLSGIQTRDPSSQAASDLRIRAQGHWDRREPLTVTGVNERTDKVQVAPLILHFGTRRGEWSTLCPRCLTLGEKAPSAH